MLYRNLFPVSQDLASRNRGAKTRDVMLVQMAFELHILLCAWRDATGRERLPLRQCAAVAKMRAVAREQQSRKRDHPGNDLIRYLNMRRAAHRRDGGSWANRADLEAAWSAEWAGKSMEDKQLWITAWEDERKARAVEALARDASLDEPAAAAAQLSLPLLARLGDDATPISEDRVDAYIRGHAARGGVRNLADAIRSRRTIFIDNPVEGRGVPEAPEVEKRCVDRTPGFCEAQHTAPARARAIAKYLHLYHSKQSSTDLEPLFLTRALDRPEGDGASDADGTWLFATSRGDDVVAVWLKCQWQTFAAIDEQVCIICSDATGDRLVERTSWQLAASMACPPERRWLFRSIRYRLMTVAELDRCGIQKHLAMVHMVQHGPQQDDVVLGEDLEELLGKLNKANKFARTAERQGVANPFLRDMASLLVSAATRSSRSRAATTSATRRAGTPVATTAAAVKGQIKPTGVAPSDRSTTVPSGSGGHSTVDESGSDPESVVGEGGCSRGSESDDIGDDAGRELKSLRAIMRREELAERGADDDRAAPLPTPPPAPSPSPSSPHEVPPPPAAPPSPPPPPAAPHEVPASPRYRFICGDTRALVYVGTLMLHRLERSSDDQPPCRVLRGATTKFAAKPRHAWLRDCPICFGDGG